MIAALLALAGGLFAPLMALAGPFIAPALPFLMPVWKVLSAFVGVFAAGVTELVTNPKTLLCAAVIAAAMWVWGDIHGTRKEHAKWMAANLEAKLLIERRDAEIQRKLTIAAKNRLEAIAKDNDDLDKKVKVYEAELAKRPAPGSHRLDRGDVKRLQSIR